MKNPLTLLFIGIALIAPAIIVSSMLAKCNKTALDEFTACIKSGEYEVDCFLGERQAKCKAKHEASLSAVRPVALVGLVVVGFGLFRLIRK